MGQAIVDFAKEKNKEIRPRGSQRTATGEGTISCVSAWTVYTEYLGWRVLPTSRLPRISDGEKIWEQWEGG
jgi:hypothetical protein